MEQLVINATKRETIGKKVKALRRESKLPGVIYGHKVDSVPVIMDQKEATTVLNKATSSSIVIVKLDGKDIATLIRERQRDYIRNSYLHVDFQAVSLTETIRTEVNIELTGVAPAVKDYSGILVEGLTSIHVEALPTDLPEKFIIDISVLKEIGDTILVKDIVVSDKVSILSPLEDMVVLVTAPEAEEEITPEAEGEEPEVIEKGKKEEEEED
ncbi:MAG TPA: 50S ribosomal protein L25 [Anaerolineaceae bacterium]|nr:50S ribosomal protein L25 [Anaerolineaceae bacterium]